VTPVLKNQEIMAMANIDEKKRAATIIRVESFFHEIAGWFAMDFAG
jgi:hypothetical protein